MEVRDAKGSAYVAFGITSFNIHWRSQAVPASRMVNAAEGQTREPTQRKTFQRVAVHGGLQRNARQESR
jgi:hypothetical protein